MIGWEFGASHGHVVTLKRMAGALVHRGHKPILAVQNAAPFEGVDLPICQAPVSPRLLVNTARRAYPAPNTLGDIMGRLGADDPDIVAALIRTWRQMLDFTGTEAVVANFAPFLLMAARGRCPTVRVGTGFETAPSDLPTFPSLTGLVASADEDVLLAQANSGLAKAGAPPLRSLPQLFAASSDIPATFAELDPYASHRSGAVQPPFISGSVPEATGEGKEVFVYLPESIPVSAPIIDGLAKSGLPVRIYLQGASDAHLERFRFAGFMVERERVPFDDIAARSRLLLSHGGHGFVCSGLLAGLPQVVCHYDLEKRLHGNALAAIRLGGHATLSRIEPDAFATSLVQLYEDEALADRARKAAPGFRARMTEPIEEIVAAEVDRLLAA